MGPQLPERIYFYNLPETFPDKREYPHMMICLGEGLKELGIQLYSNENYWRLLPDKEEYLFQYDPKITPDDCSVIILNHEWFWPGERGLPDNLFHSSRKYITVLLDNFESKDKFRHLPFSGEFSNFDFILRAHYGSGFRYPSNIYPWGFGLSKRIIQETHLIPEFQDREWQLIVNFRYPRWKQSGRSLVLVHSVRKSVHEEFEPQIQHVLPINNITNDSDSPPSDSYHYLRWTQTGKRHYPEYYQLLKSSVACSCFGGWFIAPWSRDPVLFSRFYRGIYKRLKLKSRRILQWDSWRFWESLAAGCATFHVDLEKYGVRLPIMPENWRHYIGVDLDNVQETVDRIADEPEVLARVSEEGRNWVLKHYSPLPTALRFLETIAGKLP